MSLRTRLVLLTVGLLAVGLLTAAVTVNSLLRGYLNEQVDDQLRPAATLLSHAPVSLALTSVQADQKNAASATGLALFNSPLVSYVDSDGRTVGELRHDGTLRGAAPRLPDLDGAAVAGHGARPFTVSGQDGNERWRVIAEPLTETARQLDDSSDSSATTVVVATSLSEVDATVGRLGTISAGVGAGLLAVLALVGWFAVRSGLRPLLRIEETASAIAGGDLSRRVPELAAPSTEVGRLAAVLNGMLVQIETAFAARAESEATMRRFVADASHELRTPLVGIKGFTDLYRMGALPDREDIDRTMRRISGEAERLTRLVEDMLLLARLDESVPGAGNNGRLPIHLAPTDLRTLAVDALHDIRALDPSRPVELTGPGGGTPPSSAAALADEARLRQVVTNLVGNAVTHTPAGTPVRIGVGTVDGHAVLEVADEGAGLDTQQARRVFERFYRADSSRSRSAGGGAGLGLAIVQSLVTAHGGRVQLTTAPGQGATFRVLVPSVADGEGRADGDE
ncbi:ATP-binding protein [Streptomyces sp. NPDC096311]|uniref:sensor histidine kinase n=1 Tax=Streptomyces sp. NPDC096311 TaxID=3366083 RepID=UPI00381A51D4